MSKKPDVITFKASLLQKIKDDPKNISNMINLGILEFEYFHEPEKALELFQHAEELDPANVTVKFWLATCLSIDFFKYQEAKLKLTEALIINPKSPECLSLMGWILWENNESLEDALSYTLLAVKYAPDWPMVRSQLAWLYYLLGDLEKSKLEIHNTFRIGPFDQNKISNEVESYYENTITGRSWENKQEKFEYLIQAINEKSLKS